VIFAGFFFLAFFGLWAVSAVFWVLKIVEVARIPEQQYRAAHSEKVTWILIVVLAGIFGAVIWQFAKRDAVLGVHSRMLPPPAGWYPDPAGGAMRWWDGNRWTESQTPPTGNFG
jgi:TctA family transporter